MGRVPDELLELGAEFLDVADVGPDGAVVEGTDGRAGAASGDVENGVEVLFPSLALHDAVADLVDPAGGLPAGRALAAGLVGVEAAPTLSAAGVGNLSFMDVMPAEPNLGPLLLGPSP